MKIEVCMESCMEYVVKSIIRGCCVFDLKLGGSFTYADTPVLSFMWILSIHLRFYVLEIAGWIFHI